MEVTDYLSTVKTATTALKDSVNALSKDERKRLWRDLSKHNVNADGAYRQIGNQILHMANEDDRFMSYRGEEDLLPDLGSTYFGFARTNFSEAELLRRTGLK